MLQLGRTPSQRWRRCNIGQEFLCGTRTRTRRGERSGSGERTSFRLRQMTQALPRGRADFVDFEWVELGESCDFEPEAVAPVMRDGVATLRREGDAGWATAKRCGERARGMIEYFSKAGEVQHFEAARCGERLSAVRREQSDGGEGLNKLWIALCSPAVSLRDEFQQEAVHVVSTLRLASQRARLTAQTARGSELKLRRLTEHNQRLREDLDRQRVRVSEASASSVHFPPFRPPRAPLTPFFSPSPSLPPSAPLSTPLPSRSTPPLSFLPSPPRSAALPPSRANRAETD